MTCKECGQSKPVSDFYKHPEMTTGLLNKCKECKKSYQRTRYRQKTKDPAWVAKERRRCVAKACSPAGIERMRHYREQNPEKYAAHNAVAEAIRTGGIVKPLNCERCGSDERLHSHHGDYSRPLEVVWLCTKCHRTTF